MPDKRNVTIVKGSRTYTISSNEVFIPGTKITYGYVYGVIESVTIELGESGTSEVFIRLKTDN